ncbi:MAG TPA: AfsR/SARP family transcriptional regulator [Solirubrobacteraceae bacterium]|nr:AfsR/SARP family transcriptional regulator [Solirubrobacteraceae bacterium]
MSARGFLRLTRELPSAYRSAYQSSAARFARWERTSDWSPDPPATRLEEERLTALESRIEAQLACGRHRETIGELEALTAAHPLRERLWHQLVLALYRCGRQADALRAYRKLRSTLTDQLGIEPGPELRELHDRILRQDPGLDDGRAAPHLPAEANRPQTRYAQSGEVRIAYQALGEGHRDIVFVPGAMSHLDLLVGGRGDRRVLPRPGRARLAGHV